MEGTKNIENQIAKLFDAGIHLGHKVNRIHPKAKKYIYKIDSGVSIIDLTKTLISLNEAKKYVAQLAKEGKSLLVVVTKKIVSVFVKELCIKANLSYITNKWPAGLITNFETIKKNIKVMNKMREEKENGEWEKYVKHEKATLQKKLNRLERLYSGLNTFEKLPDALFIVDIKKEKNALLEANKKQIPIVAVVDTNSDPTQVQFPIVGNDDSALSIEYLVKEIIEAYVKGKK